MLPSRRAPGENMHPSPKGFGITLLNLVSVVVDGFRGLLEVVG